MSTEAQPVRVLIRKADGVTIAPFKEYAQEQLGQARIDVRALRGFDIDAFVEGEDPPGEGDAAPVSDARSSQASP